MLDKTNLASSLWIKLTLLEVEDLVKETQLIEKSKEHSWNCSINSTDSISWEELKLLWLLTGQIYWIPLS